MQTLKKKKKSVKRERKSKILPRHEMTADRAVPRKELFKCRCVVYTEKQQKKV